MAQGPDQLGGRGCPICPVAWRRESHAEVEQLIAEAIGAHIESLREHGEPVPEPSSTAGAVQVPAA